MAITFLPPKKKKTYFFALLLIVPAIIAVWYILNIKPVILEPAALSGPQKTEINWDVLKDSRLDRLQDFEEISPFLGETGRENPFTPY